MIGRRTVLRGLAAIATLPLLPRAIASPPPAAAS